jgi:recombination protein RecT
MSGQMQPFQQKYKSMREMMEKREAEFSAALPKAGALDAKRFLRTALTTFQVKPELLDCTPQSVIVSLLQAAQFGLELDPVLGQAYLVPYGKTCQLIIGYKGYMVLARRSNLVTSIDARAVREKDYFEFELGLDRKLVHRPYWGAEDPGDIVGVYVLARFTNGDHSAYPMHRREIDKIKNRSRAKSGPWTTDFEAMAVKTGIRQAQKFWPIYIEDLARAAELDDAVDSGRDQIIANVGPGIDILPPEPEQEAEQKPKGKLDQFVEAQAAGAAEKPAEKKADPPVEPKQKEKKPEAAKTGAPESPTTRDRAKGDQAARHEVPRAHQAAVQEAQSGDLLSDQEAADLDRELAEKESSGVARGREPGSDDE